MRRLFTIASAVSLLLCVASITIWIRGGDNYDTVYAQQMSGSRRGILLISADRRMMVSLAHDFTARHAFGYTSSPLTYIVLLMLLHDHNKWDFGWIYSEGEFVLSLPDWFLTCLTALLPITFAFVKLRGNRMAGKCSCGYNLTGNISGVCPECGTATTPKFEVKA